MFGILKFLFTFYEDEAAVSKIVNEREARMNRMMNGDKVPEYSKKLFLLMTEDDARREISQRRSLQLMTFLLVGIGIETGLAAFGVF